MIFKIKKHYSELYNTLLYLSRNLYFYNNINLKDTFETRIYLMFMHFSIILIIYKKKNLAFPQNSYDDLFHCIENNLRELGFGDVSVNKKMKEYVNLFYTILEKIENWEILDNNKKFETIANFINIDEDNDKFVNYFDKYREFILNNSLKNFTKDILEFKF